MLMQVIYERKYSFTVIFYKHVLHMDHIRKHDHILSADPGSRSNVLHWDHKLEMTADEQNSGKMNMVLQVYIRMQN